MAEVIWTKPAISQLDAIAEFIALDKPDAAAAVVQKIFGLTDHLEVFIKLGREIPEYPNPTYRQVWVAPCWLYYRTEGKKVVFILHVRRAERPLRIEDLFVEDV